MIESTATIYLQNHTANRRTEHYDHGLQTNPQSSQDRVCDESQFGAARTRDAEKVER